MNSWTILHEFTENIFSTCPDLSEDGADDSRNDTLVHSAQQLIEVTRYTQADLWQADKPTGKLSR